MPSSTTAARCDSRRRSRRQRQSDGVVEIALRDQHRRVAEVRAEDRRDHFLHRRLAVAADDDRQRDVELRRARTPRGGRAQRADPVPRSGRPQRRRAIGRNQRRSWHLARARRRRTRVRRSVRPSSATKRSPASSARLSVTTRRNPTLSPISCPSTACAAVFVSIIGRSTPTTRRRPRRRPRMACARRRAPGTSRGPCRRRARCRRFRRTDRAADRLGAVDLDRPAAIALVANASRDGVGDGRRILAARIVAGHHDAIGEARRDVTHLRTLAGIAVAATAEDADQFARRHDRGPQCGQHLLQRIRRVRVVDDDQRPVGAAQSLHAAGRRLQAAPAPPSRRRSARRSPAGRRARPAGSAR